MEDQFVKSEVYKANRESVYQLNFQKMHLRYANESGKLIIITVFYYQWKQHGNKTIISAKFPNLKQRIEFFLPITRVNE